MIPHFVILIFQVNIGANLMIDLKILYIVHPNILKFISMLEMTLVIRMETQMKDVDKDFIV